MSSDSPEPTNVRPTLRQRRDELDAEIAHRETTQADAYNEQHEQLQSALLAFAEQHGGWTDSQRKNVASITVNGAVTVEFIPAEPEPQRPRPHRHALPPAVGSPSSHGLARPSPPATAPICVADHPGVFCPIAEGR